MHLHGFLKIGLKDLERKFECLGYKRIKTFKTPHFRQYFMQRGESEIVHFHKSDTMVLKNGKWSWAGEHKTTGVWFECFEK